MKKRLVEFLVMRAIGVLKIYDRALKFYDWFIGLFRRRK